MQSKNTGELKIRIYIITLLQLILISGCKSQENKDPEVSKLLEKVKEDFVFVEGGTFMMGNNQIPTASPAHEVTLDSYSIAKYEVTLGQYDIYTRINGLEKVAPRYREQQGMGPEYGAWNMNWYQAREYCQWLGKQLELPIDLPTEAQWEYAARNRGENIDHATNSGLIEGGENDNYGVDTPVGNFPPNPLGIYDMSGSKAEWILDWYGNYKSKPQVNPKGRLIREDEDASRGQKVVRGFRTIVKTTYRRKHLSPDNTGAGNGIRCVCNQKTPVN